MYCMHETNKILKNYLEKNLNVVQMILILKLDKFINYKNESLKSVLFFSQKKSEGKEMSKGKGNTTSKAGR